jgi:hypothetical protein
MDYGAEWFMEICKDKPALVVKALIETRVLAGQEAYTEVLKLCEGKRKFTRKPDDSGYLGCNVCPFVVEGINYGFPECKIKKLLDGVC